MEKDHAQRYVANLEQVIRNTHLDLRETMTQFQEYSQRVTAERLVASGIITDIRRAYKGIQDHLTKIRGVNQLLESRYRQYYRRDSLRDKEIAEFGVLAKNLYTRFELILQEIETNRKARDKEADPGVSGQPTPFQWFQSTENQGMLLRNLQDLYELDYKARPELGADGSRRVTEDKLRSLSLFVLSGEEGLVNDLQSRMRLREHDIKERCASNELRGALTHLKRFSLSEAEGVIRRFAGGSEAQTLKCLLFSIQSQEDLGKEMLRSAKTILKGMTKGEVRRLPA